MIDDWRLMINPMVHVVDIVANAHCKPNLGPIGSGLGLPFFFYTMQTQKRLPFAAQCPPPLDKSLFRGVGLMCWFLLGQGGQPIYTTYAWLLAAGCWLLALGWLLLAAACWP